LIRLLGRNNDSQQPGHLASPQQAVPSEPVTYTREPPREPEPPSFVPVLAARFTTDSLLPPNSANRTVLPPLVQTNQRPAKVNYQDLHAKALAMVIKKKRTLVFDLGGLGTWIHPNPLAAAPLGINMMTYESENSAFCQFTAPKFLVVVMGAFPNMDAKIHKHVYCKWSNILNSFLYMSYGDDAEFSAAEVNFLKMQLDSVVLKQAEMTEGFVDAALDLYSGDYATHLINVIPPWFECFFQEIHRVVNSFKTETAKRRAYMKAAPILSHQITLEEDSSEVSD
jgi:hypothetical protein